MKTLQVSAQDGRQNAPTVEKPFIASRSNKSIARTSARF